MRAVWVGWDRYRFTVGWLVNPVNTPYVGSGGKGPPQMPCGALAVSAGPDLHR